jgi:hypothetical protein
MLHHFQLMGDYYPNCGGEIHLEPCYIVEIYGEYFQSLEAAGIKVVNVDQFASLWTNCFPYVKIREFKAVSGKCHCCSKLSVMRRTFKSQQDREYVTMMHGLHRTAYMGERMDYADRRNKAVMEKSKYMSTIADGMAQGHNMLPHFANQDSWSDGLPQHLQGILNHNRGMTIYRTFHNINNCANVAIHSFLLELQRIVDEEGKLPDTIFHQIDGGSENTANCWFVLCELLVARRVCKKVVLTRLMVGHTHEDIDSKFGTLWKKIRSRFVLTPQQYEAQIIKALSTNKHACKVVDLLAIPDYKKLLDAHIDPEFSACTKMEKTQLQWTFEAVTPDDFFPHGVRVFHRAFSSDNVVQILEDPSKTCKVYAKASDVFDFPIRDFSKGILRDGMHVMTSLPTEYPTPYPFVEGSREVLDAVLVKIRSEYQVNHADVVMDWNIWAGEVAPKSDSVDEYIRDHPLVFPLGDILFSDKPVDPAVVEPWGDENSIIRNLERMRTTDCVKWSRWGFKRDDHSTEYCARVERCMIAGQIVERDALPRRVVVFRKWKKRQKTKDDEDGDYSFVLGREFPNDMASSFIREGQVIAVKAGGKRVYWKNKRSAQFFPSDVPDKTFEHMVRVGWFAYGEIDAPSDGLGNTGVVRLCDVADPRCRYKSGPIIGVVLSDNSDDEQHTWSDDDDDDARRDIVPAAVGRRHAAADSSHVAVVLRQGRAVVPRQRIAAVPRQMLATAGSSVAASSKQLKSGSGGAARAHPGSRRARGAVAQAKVNHNLSLFDSVAASRAHIRCRGKQSVSKYKDQYKRKRDQDSSDEEVEEEEEEVEEEEEEEEEEESEDPGSRGGGGDDAKNGAKKEDTDSVDDENDDCSNDDYDEQLYEVGDKIRNAYNFNGTVIGYSNGRYDVKFSDGEIVTGMKQKLLKAGIKPSGKKKINTSGSWNMEVVPAGWIDSGAVGAIPTLTGKRDRKSVNK